MKQLVYIFLVVVLAACNKQKDIGPGSTAAEPGDFLSADNYRSMQIQVVFEKGFAPENETLEQLRQFLVKHLNKPDGIEIISTEIPLQNSGVYSVEKIREIETKYRSVFRKGTQVSAFVFFAGGDYQNNQGDAKVLGIAYGESSMCVFEKTVEEFSGGLTQPSQKTVESSVLNHEFGHVLGLVNNGTKPVSEHQDAAHGRHCDDKNCLMYYATETSDLISNLIGENVPGLDDNCINDLKSAGGK
mgnify:CR=1 FL=1